MAKENPVIHNGYEYWVATNNLKEVTGAETARKIIGAAIAFSVFLAGAVSCLVYGIEHNVNVFCVMGLLCVFVSIHQLYILMNVSNPKKETEPKEAPKQKPYDLFETVNKVETKTDTKFKKFTLILKPFLIGILLKTFKKLPDIAILWALLKLFNLLNY